MGLREILARLACRLTSGSVDAPAPVRNILRRVSETIFSVSIAKKTDIQVFDQRRSRLFIKLQI